MLMHLFRFCLTMDGYCVLVIYNIVFVYVLLNKRTCYASICNDLRMSADGVLPTASYSVTNSNGNAYNVYCQFYSGYGYAFLSKDTDVDVVDMTSLYDDTSHVIIRHQRLDGYQYTAQMEQLSSYSNTPIFVQYNGYDGYQSLQNMQMTPYIFVGFIPENVTKQGDTHGWKTNDMEFTFINCDGNPNSYIAFLFDNNNKGYTRTSLSVNSLAYSWYDLATQVAESEYLPDGYFTPSFEIHHGGCGAYSTADAVPDITGAAVGVRFTITCAPPGDLIGGSVSYTSTIKGSIVTYACSYAQLHGDSSRTCTESGKWTGIRPSCKELENTALGKQAYQTDDNNGGGGEAQLAVDGGLSQYWADGSCTLTETRADSYWEVDLGNIYVIDHVIIFERIDPCCNDRLRDVELYTGLSQTTYNLIRFNAGSMTSSGHIQPDHTIHARWVKITRIHSVDETLSLCEVQVMGYKLRTLLYEHSESTTGSGAVISSAKSKSKIDCCRHCFQTPGCIGVNLHLDTMMCDLLDTESGIASVDDQTVLYIAKYTTT